MEKQLELGERFWADIPTELIQEILNEMPQEHLLLVTNVKIPGFRTGKGKVPAQILFTTVNKALKEWPQKRERLIRYLLENTDELRQVLKKTGLKKVKSKALELIGEEGKNPVVLSLFLDSRKGTKKIAKELWEIKAEDLIKQETTADPQREDVSSEDNSDLSKLVTRLERNLAKSEKKRTEERKKFNRIISSKDKNMNLLRKELKGSNNQTKELEKEMVILKERELEQKIKLKKLEDDLSVINGQLKKVCQDQEALLTENRSLRVSLAKLEKEQATASETTDEAPKLAVNNLSGLVGQFTFSGGEGWLISDNQMFNIPMNLIKEHGLVMGDKLEIDFQAEEGGKVFSLRVLEKVEGQEISGYLLFHKEHYWVKAGSELIHVGAQEVVRVKAEEGDPVSIMVPFSAENKEGYITKVHRVYDIKELTEKKAPVRKPKVFPVRKNYVKTLEAVKLLVVGGDSLKHRYLEEFKLLGAEVQWQSGFEEITAVPKKVSKAEVVLLLTSINSHAATNLARQAAQHYGRKVLYYHSTSIRGAVNAVERFCRQEKALTIKAF